MHVVLTSQGSMKLRCRIQLCRGRGAPDQIFSEFRRASSLVGRFTTDSSRYISKSYYSLFADVRTAYQPKKHTVAEFYL
jgi:hypothetical protein